MTAAAGRRCGDAPADEQGTEGRLGDPDPTGQRTDHRCHQRQRVEECGHRHGDAGCRTRRGSAREHALPMTLPARGKRKTRSGIPEVGSDPQPRQRVDELVAGRGSGIGFRSAEPEPHART